MLNYLKSECYRVSKRLYTALFLLFGTGAAFLANLMLRTSTEESMAVSLDIGASLLLLPTYLLVPLITDIVFSEEYKHSTLKNVVSFGIPRLQIYFGKLLAQLVLALAALLLVYGSYLLFALLLLGPGDWAQTGPLLTQFLLHVASAFPLWLTGLAIANLLVFAIRSGGLFTTAFFGYALVLPLLTGQLLAPMYPFFAAIYPFTIHAHFNLLAETEVTAAVLADCWTTGLLFTTLYISIGALLARRREIK